MFKKNTKITQEMKIWNLAFNNPQDTSFLLMLLQSKDFTKRRDIKIFNIIKYLFRENLVLDENDEFNREKFILNIERYYYKTSINKNKKNTYIHKILNIEEFDKEKDLEVLCQELIQTNHSKDKWWLKLLKTIFFPISIINLIVNKLKNKDYDEEPKSKIMKKNLVLEKEILNKVINNQDLIDIMLIYLSYSDFSKKNNIRLFKMIKKIWSLRKDKINIKDEIKHSLVEINNSKRKKLEKHLRSFNLSKINENVETDEDKDKDKKDFIKKLMYLKKITENRNKVRLKLTPISKFFISYFLGVATSLGVLILVYFYTEL